MKSERASSVGWCLVYMWLGGVWYICVLIMHSCMHVHVGHIRYPVVLGAEHLMNLMGKLVAYTLNSFFLLVLVCASMLQF